METKPKTLEVSVLKWVKQKDDPHTGLNTITIPDVVFHHGVPRNVIKMHLEREVEESQACWSLPFTLLLVLSYAVVAMTHDNAAILRSVEESLDHDILENANFAFHGPMGFKGIDDVNSVADFWSWLSNGLVPLIFQQSKSWHEGYDESDVWYANNSDMPLEDRGTWLSYNRIVGGVRIRQERSENKKCESVKQLLAVYDMSCVGGHGWELDPEIRPARFTQDPVKEWWLYVYDDMSSMQKIVWDHERTRWLDRNTMKVEVAIPAYNGELGLHIMIYIGFFFSRGGHIWKKLMPLGFPAQLHPYWYYWIGDFIWLICVIYVFIAEVIEIAGIWKRKGVEGIKTEYLNFWNAFDWFSMMCAFVVICMFAAVMDMLNGLNDSLEVLKDPIAVGFNSTSYTKQLNEHVALLEDTVKYVNNFRLVMASYPLVIVLRLFKAYSAQPRLAMVTKTLETAGQELLEFGLVFFSVFITITISGVVLFGREVPFFGTLPRGVFASFRMLIGDLMWEDTSKVGRLFAFAWTLLFMVINVMLLLNMLLAIIMKHYVQAKDSAGNAQTLWSEAAQVFHRWRSDRKGTTVPMEKLLLVLEKQDRIDEIAREDEEEDMHFETEEEAELATLGPIVTQQDLLAAYAEHAKGPMLGEEQAQEVMEAAVDEYYGDHNSALDLDEVLRLTHKVEHRTQKLNKLGRELDKINPCPNEVETMSEFLKDMETFTDELRAQYGSHRQEVQELRTLKRGLLLQLQTRQSLMNNTAENDPISVNALIAKGDYSRYNWKLGSRYSDDPVPPERLGDDPGDLSMDSLQHEDLMYDVGDVSSGALVPGSRSYPPSGSLTGVTQTSQPRYAMDDPLSDDDMPDNVD